MATLADVWSRMFAQSMERAAPMTRDADAYTRVRSFANEDILFYTKRIDNTRVVREADPVARGRCWKLMASVVGAAVLLIAVLLPSAYGLMAGYQIESLRAEKSRMDAEQASLELSEAKLLSPARMEELARIQEFVDPAPQKVVYLESQQQGSLAMNRK
jgi:hypothetical protein